MRLPERSMRRAVVLVALGWSVLAFAAPADPPAVEESPVAASPCLRDEGAAGAQARIRGERDALALRERAVRQQEEHLGTTRREIERRLAELASLRSELDARIARLEAARDERVAQLADLYGRMPAERAAAVIAALDADLAARIVGHMRRARGAAVLAELPGPRATEISRRLLAPTSTVPPAGTGLEPSSPTPGTAPAP